MGIYLRSYLSLPLSSRINACSDSVTLWLGLNVECLYFMKFKNHDFYVTNKQMLMEDLMLLNYEVLFKSIFYC
jgi:hypothetical protein